MAAKRTSVSRSKKPATSALPGFSWKKLLLLVSLLPVAAGILLIIGWALDIYVWQAQIQLDVAIFSLLLGFTLSNVAQQNWILSVGWCLLAVGDLLFLSTRTELIYTAVVLSVLGGVMVVQEVVRRVVKQRKGG